MRFPEKDGRLRIMEDKMIELLADEIEALRTDIESNTLDVGELVYACNTYIELRQQLAVKMCHPYPKGMDIELLSADVWIVPGELEIK